MTHLSKGKKNILGRRNIRLHTEQYFIYANYIYDQIIFKINTSRKQKEDTKDRSMDVKDMVIKHRYQLQYTLCASALSNNNLIKM